MAELFEQLKELFELPKGKLETANRKTLLNFVAKNEFQKRRQAHFEACCQKGKKKSRVSLCKKAQRPSFAINLETLNTKKIRETIADFLKLIKYQKAKGSTPQQLDKLAENNRWHEVVYLSHTGLRSDSEEEEQKEESPKKKKGGAVGGGKDWKDELPKDERKKIERREKRMSLLPENPIAERPAQRRRRPRRALSVELERPPVRRRRARPIVVRQGKFKRITRAVNPDGSYVNPPDVYDQEPVTDEGSDVSEVSGNPFEDIELPHPGRKKKRKPLVKQGQRLRTTAVPVKTQIEGPVESEAQEKPSEPGKDPEEISEKKEASTLRECSVIEPLPDSCRQCEPVPADEVKLTKKQRKEYDRLNALKKMTCAKLDLLKCTLDLQSYQRRVWEMDSLNTHGDYFSNATEKELQRLKQFTSPQDRDRLKAILANQSMGSRLKKGHEQLNIRLKNLKKKLGKDYTLPHLRYDQVKDLKARNNDQYSKRALQNRSEEPPVRGKIDCQKVKLPEKECKKCETSPQDSRVPKAAEKQPSTAPVSKVSDAGGATDIKKEEPSDDHPGTNPVAADPISELEMGGLQMGGEQPAATFDDYGAEHGTLPNVMPGLDLTRDSPRSLQDIATEEHRKTPLLEPIGAPQRRGSVSSDSSDTSGPAKLPTATHTSDKSPVVSPSLSPERAAATQVFRVKMPEIKLPEPAKLDPGNPGELRKQIDIPDKEMQLPSLVRTVTPVIEVSDSGGKQSRTAHKAALRSVNKYMQEIDRYQNSPVDYLPPSNELPTYTKHIPSFLAEIQRTNVITAPQSLKMFEILDPIFRKVPWLDKDAGFPRKDRKLSSLQLSNVIAAFTKLLREPENVTHNDMFKILKLLVPDKVASERQRIARMSENLMHKQLIVQRAQNLKPAGGFQAPAKPTRTPGHKSRVGALLLGRNRRRRKPRKVAVKKAKKQRAKRKPRVKKEKLEIPSLEDNFIEPDTRDVPSPRIKKPASPPPQISHATISRPPTSDFVFPQRKKRFY